MIKIKDMGLNTKKSFLSVLQKALGLEDYQYIMENVHKVNMSDVNNKDTRKFRTTYNRFYNVRHKSGNAWYDHYYQVFEKMKHEENNATFERILNEISIETVDASFASKMLATLNPDKPILDSRVLNNFKITIKGNTKQEKIKSSIEAYKKIEAEYEEYLPSKEARENIDLFDEIFPEYARNSNSNAPLISDIKKIDFIIWGNDIKPPANKK